MRRGTPAAWLLAALPLVCAAELLHAQGRPREIDCSFLLLSGCRSYVIEVVRVEPDGTERVQPDADTYAVVDPDTLDPARYLVLSMYPADGRRGERAVLWVDRASGAVGGNWPSTLSNDAVRSAELVGVPGDVVQFHDDAARRRGGSARLVIFAGRDRCRTEVNLNDRSGGCSTLERRNVAGKVSAITVRYRAAADAISQPVQPGAAPVEPATPGEPAPADSAPAGLPDSVPAAPLDSLGAAPQATDSLTAPQ